MKKLCVLVSLVLLLLSSVASAANWQWITSSDEYGFFFDSDSIHYGRGYNTIDRNSVTYWLKTVFTPESAAALAEEAQIESLRDADYAIEKSTDHFREKIVTHYGNRTFYSKSGKILHQTPPGYWHEDIIPGSFGDVISYVIQQYCIANDKVIQKRSSY